MATYIYCRVSPKPDGKADPADSLDTQESACREYCQRAKLELTAAFRDSEVSARKTALEDRPAGKAIAAALEPGDTVVVYRLDRIFRCVSEGEQTLDQWAIDHITLIAAMGGQQYCLATSAGWLAAIMQLVFAALEPKVTAERTAAAMKAYQRNGRSMSHKPPYGYTQANGLLLEDHDEQATLAAARAAVLEHGGYKGAAHALNSMGHRRRNGKRWSAWMLKRCVERSSAPCERMVR